MAQKRTANNQDTGLLGLIAIFCMICDHLGAAFFPREMWMRVVGRIAFPLYAWGVAVGAEHTRSLERYALRLFALGVVAQPFYMYAMGHPLQKMNVLCTLLLGLLCVAGLKKNRLWLTAAALLIACFVEMDYGVRGVLLVLLLWAVRDNPFALAICFSAFCVYWGANSSVVWSAGIVSLRLQQCALLALPLMLWPRSTRTRVPRGLTYAAYPGHLALIWLVKMLLR